VGGWLHSKCNACLRSSRRHLDISNLVLLQSNCPFLRGDGDGSIRTHCKSPLVEFRASNANHTTTNAPEKRRSNLSRRSYCE
ncbi:hypothetical protein PoB_001344800, partial [Plakobranchus ocellatus]